MLPDLTPEQEAELLLSIAEADRGETVSAEEVLAKVARPFKGDHVADLWVLGDVHGLLQLLERNASAEASGPAQAARHPSRAS